MRNGSAAIFPLLLAIMAMFWFIWAMGGATDTLHRVNDIEDLQNLQERLLPAAMQKYIDEVEQPGHDNQSMDEKRLRATKEAHDKIQEIMKKNKVDD